MYDTCGDRPLLGSVLIEQGVIEGADVDRALRARLRAAIERRHRYRRDFAPTGSRKASWTGG